MIRAKLRDFDGLSKPEILRRIANQKRPSLFSQIASRFQSEEYEGSRSESEKWRKKGMKHGETA